MVTARKQPDTPAQYSIRRNIISAAHLASGKIQTQSSGTAQKKRNRFGQYLTISATNTNVRFCLNLLGEFLPLKKKEKKEREVSPFAVIWSVHWYVCAYMPAILCIYAIHYLLVWFPILLCELDDTITIPLSPLIIWN